MPSWLKSPGGWDLVRITFGHPSAQHTAGASEIKHALKQYTAGQLSLQTYWLLQIVLYHMHLTRCGRVLTSWKTIAACVFLVWKKICFLMVKSITPLLFLFISFFHFSLLML